MREKPVAIEVRKAGQHWAVYAEEQLVAQTVYEKGALTLEALLRGCLRYTSRKFFRLALSDAMKGPKPAAPVKSEKPPKAAKPAKEKTAPAKAKARKPAVKKESVTDAAPTPAPEPVTPVAPAPVPAEPTTPQPQ
ncbi:MAG: hypothetical protein ACLQM8_24935 [Limisphaerales bacterium]